MTSKMTATVCDGHYFSRVNTMFECLIPKTGSIPHISNLRKHSDSSDERMVKTGEREGVRQRDVKNEGQGAFSKSTRRAKKHKTTKPAVQCEYLPSCREDEYFNKPRKELSVSPTFRRKMDQGNRYCVRR